MAVNASKVNMQYDVDAAVILRDIADGAETSTATETAVSLSELDTAYWHGNEIPHGVFEIGVHVSALNLSTNTYAISLLVDDASGLNDSPVTIASYNITAVGFYKFLVDSKSLPGLDSDSSGTDKWIGIRVTIAGVADSPSITYGAWIGKSIAP